jgi:ABC-type transport system involved in multi-copper enzyme maturation permease subunit
MRLIASQTLAEALRLRLSGLLVAMAALLLLGARWLREFNFGTTEIAFLGDFGLGVIGLGGTLLAVMATAHLFFNDLSAGAAACVLTRPVRRWEYVLGKFAGVAGLLALFTAALGGLLGGLISWRSGQLGIPGAALPVFASACALQWMKFTLIAGMTLGVSTYATSALFASCAGMLLALIGYLRPLVSGHLQWLEIWPNLTLFDASGVLAGTQPATGSFLIHLAGYWAISCAWVGALASYVFKHREF